MYNDSQMIAKSWENKCKEEREERRRKKKEQQDKDNRQDDDESKPLTDEKKQSVEVRHRRYAVATHPKKFPKYKPFCDAKESYNKMVTMGVWQDYKNYCRKFCKFSDANLDSRKVLFLNNEVCKLLINHVSLWPACLPLLKLIIPTTDGKPWVLKETAQSKSLSCLLLPLKESKTFQLSIAPTKQLNSGALAVPHKEEETKRRARPKASAKAKAIEKLSAT
eukprot:3738143-Pyramimonas_sp.AAC.1